MIPATQQGLSEARLKETTEAVEDLAAEVRRLRQREADLVAKNQNWVTLYEGILAPELNRKGQKISDLETALNLQEGLYKELQAESVHPLDPDYPLPSFLSQEPTDDHGEYARGGRG